MIEQFHKSMNAPVLYPTMPHSEQNVHISVPNRAFWDMEHMHREICELGQLLQHQLGNTEEYMEK